jgi:hypothetical protein
MSLIFTSTFNHLRCDNQSIKYESYFLVIWLVTFGPA